MQPHLSNNKKGGGGGERKGRTGDVKSPTTPVSGEVSVKSPFGFCHPCQGWGREGKKKGRHSGLPGSQALQQFSRLSKVAWRRALLLHYAPTGKRKERRGGDRIFVAERSGGAQGFN